MENVRTKNGFSMPVFGVGTWLMGGAMSYDPANKDDRDIAAIRRAIDAGITHIDTAEMYAAGYSEELVGRAIKGYDRNRLFIVSKVSPQNLKYDDVIASAKNSLQRLGTNYLDLYLIHKPNPSVPLEETIGALDDLVDAGLVKNIGISNFTTQRTKEAIAATRNKIRATQVHYNLIYREPEKEGLLDFCRENNILVIAWRPVQQGIIGQNNSELMTRMCQKYEKSSAQIAINWLVSQPNIVTLSTMRNPKHLQENLGALDWKMDESDIELLRKEFPGQKMVSDAVPLE